jgi:NAD(P)-dependent dehydrogenase (short-subunit alcohol dehydrogenase family)
VGVASDGPPLRALVNLVGAFAADQPVADTPLADFERLFALNLRPTYLVTQAVLPRLVAEGRPDGVRCNAIVPSQIETPANREAMPQSEWVKLVPPERIASAVAFLCSEDSAATNGATVPI